jgi:Na+-transporting NADH:ubiquinone oxidoreductase subunit NqrC
MNDLPHNRVSQIFFALEVMKQCAFGRARFINDAIETTTLKSVFVKFVESSLEDLSSRVFWRSSDGRFHSMSEDTDQSVCVNIQIFFSNFGHTIGS